MQYIDELLTNTRIFNKSCDNSGFFFWKPRDKEDFTMVQVSSEKTVKTQTMLEKVLTMTPTARVERLRESYLNLKTTASIDRRV